MTEFKTIDYITITLIIITIISSLLSFNSKEIHNKYPNFSFLVSSTSIITFTLTVLNVGLLQDYRLGIGISLLPFIFLLYRMIYLYSFVIQSRNTNNP